jgi:hypothetical protein
MRMKVKFRTGAPIRVFQELGVNMKVKTQYKKGQFPVTYDDIKVLFTGLGVISLLSIIFIIPIVLLFAIRGNQESGVNGGLQGFSLLSVTLVFNIVWLFIWFSGGYNRVNREK